MSNSIEQYKSWEARPWLAVAVRVALAITPPTASFAATLVFAREFPALRTSLSSPLWWLVMFFIGFSAMVITDRLTRRMMPLAALLNLTLLFPDRAPSRFATAMRTSTTRQLQRRIAEVQKMGDLRPEDANAQKMLELVAALSVHDRLTRGHCERVRAYTDLIAVELGLDRRDADRLRWAALLHDIGKLVVPDEILNKPGALDDDEWEILRSHTWQGQRLAEPLKDWLGDWGRAIGEHHERWAGGGYPNNLSGEQIHLGARIVAVADAYDVMTSTRSYKQAIPAADARAEIARCAGTQFDPDVVRAFLSIGLGRLRFAFGPLSWLANLRSAGQATIAPVTAPIATVGASAAAVVALSGSGWVANVGSVPDNLAFREEQTTVTVADPGAPRSVQPDTTFTIPSTTTTAEPEAAAETTTTTATTTTTTTLPAAPTPTTVTSAPTGPTSTTSATPTTEASTTTVSVTPATPTIKPEPVAEPPSISAQALQVVEDTATAFDVKVNSAATAVTIAVVAEPALGSLSPTGSDDSTSAPTEAGEAASFTFVPAEDLSGSDSFVLEACDLNDQCTQANVSVAIAPVNDLPVVANQFHQLPEDESLTIDEEELMAASYDVDGDAMTLEVGKPHFGSLREGDFKTWVYQPPRNSESSDSVPITVCDSDGCSEGKIEVEILPVNESPDANPSRLTTPEDTELIIEPDDLLANVTDPEADTLQVKLGAPSSGKVEGDGPWTFSTGRNFFGEVTAPIVVCDPSGLCDETTLTVDVLPVNDPPILLEEFTVYTDEDRNMALWVDYYDPEDDPIFFETTETTLGELQTRGQKFIYKPHPNVNGSDYSDVTGCDPSGACDTLRLNFVINPVNDAPEAGDIHAWVLEGGILEISELDFLANTVDVDDDELQVTRGDAELGSIVDGVYHPPSDPDQTTDRISFTVCDPSADCDEAFVQITIRPRDAAPAESPSAVVQILFRSDPALLTERGVPAMLRRNS